MNQLATGIAEKALALGVYLTRVRSTPDPSRPLDEMDLAWQSLTPETFYAAPEQAPEVRFENHGRWPGAIRKRFTFPSSYVSPYPENNIVHGRADLRPGGKARAALVVVHGHAMNSLSLLERYTQPAVRTGMDAYFISLPYHMRRTPRGTWSGQYSLNADIAGTALAFMQGVRDVRSLISWIECNRPAPVVMLGVSLGAFTASMTAVVDDRAKAVVSVLGGGSLAQLIWDGYQMNRSKKQLIARGVTCEQLEEYWRLLGPANWKPKVARDRILLLAGEFDPIVTPENVSRLWRAWDHPAVHWYSTGHATIVLFHRQVRKEVFRFLVDRI